MEGMSQIFYKVLSHYTDEDYLYFYFKYHLAPVVAHLKPAATLTITRDIQEIWNRYGVGVVKKLGLEWQVLRNKEKSIILFLYRKEALEDVIKDKAIEEYLRKIGYPVEDLEGVIQFLIKRYTLFSCPHEIGLLLGIPLEDVKAFTDDPYRPCLLKGYWKVYSNQERAKALFKAYDQVRLNAIKAPI